MPEFDRVAFNAHLHKVATQEAIVRAAESRAQVLSSKASQNEKFGDAASEAIAQVQDEQEKLDQLIDERDNWGKDLEGTKISLSDKVGNFAQNARVARAGGTHIEGSNSVDGTGDAAEDPEEAGTDPIVGPPVVQGLGGAGQTLDGKRVAPVDDDEDTDTSVEVERGSRKRGSKAASRRRAKERDEDEGTSAAE